MNADFVSFDLAKKLKEKGFDEKCYTFYEHDSKEFYREERIPCCNSCSDDYAAPTISQVLKWLREEKNLNVEVHISMRGGWYNIIYEIAPRRGFDLKHMLIEKKSYEEASIAGIEYVIDNLI